MIDTCVCCGEYVPEGRMVCPLCVSKGEKKADEACKNDSPLSLNKSRGLAGRFVRSISRLSRRRAR